MDQATFNQLPVDEKLNESYRLQNEIYRIMPKPTAEGRGHAGMEEAFGRPETPNAPPEPLDEEFQAVFGHLRGPRGEMLLTNAELSTWKTLYKGWDGLQAVPGPAQKVLDLVNEYNAGAGNEPVRAVAFGLNGQRFLTFPDLPGAKYGTLECSKVGAILFAMQTLDGALKIIGKLR